MKIESMKMLVLAIVPIGVAIVACSDDSAVASTALKQGPGIVSAILASGGTPQRARVPLVAAPTNAVIDPQATAALAQMTQFFTQAQSLSFTALTTTEDVSSSGQKLQFDTKVRGFITRPNQLFLEKSGAENVSLWFDGSQLIVLDRTANTYLSVAAPGNLDVLQAKLDDLGIETPFSGLLRSDLPTQVAEYVFQGDFYSSTLIDDHAYNHLAFRQENVDWQLWTDVETGAPKKAVITSKMLAGAPQHSLFIQEMTINESVDKTVFAVALPAGAREASVTP